jgi:serine protease Do
MPHSDLSTSPGPSGRKPLSARRLSLLASAAGLGIAVLVAGPGGYLPVWGITAHAASVSETSPASAQHPAGFADLVTRVKPAVVSIRVKIDESVNMTRMGQNDEAPSFEPGSPSDRFFRQFGSPNGQNGMRQPRRVITGEGSGFFISADGYAVTNNHVVDHAKSVQVTTDDGAVYTAKVIGSDQRSDLALIKVDADKQFPFVKFADQAPRIGDWVVAVGNPFGLGGTVTAGIVSARGRDIGAGPYDDYVQIDAPINKGNSGGPAFDTDGNVIGVNTAIYSPSGGSVGIGFDIPAETAKMVVAQIKDKGYVTRGWMGVQIQPVTAAIADSLGMKTAQGAIVDEPQPGSPAAKAGIAAGDVITSVNGTPVKDSRDLARTIARLAPGATVKLDVLRNGTAKNIDLTLAEMPKERQARADSSGQATPESGVPHLGLSLAPAAEVGAGSQGVAVVNVDPDGPAAEHGFQAGDVILDVGGKPVSNVSDVRQAMTDARAQGKHDVLVRVKTANATRFVALPLGNA